MVRISITFTWEVEGPAHASKGTVSRVAVDSFAEGGVCCGVGALSHRMVLRVVPQTLRHGRVAKEERQVGENVLARVAEGARGGDLFGRCCVPNLRTYPCHDYRCGLWLVLCLNGSHSVPSA